MTEKSKWAGVWLEMADDKTIAQTNENVKKLNEVRNDINKFLKPYDCEVCNILKMPQGDHRCGCCGELV